jgi:acetylglutamate kinase
MIKQNKIPIISPLGLDTNNQAYNINGDTAAMAIAKSLKSRRLLLVTNVDGVLDKEKKLITEISSSKVLEFIRDETITEGMIPKINACLDAINNGVTAVGIINGTKIHSCLWEIFSDKGSGTLIRK